MFSTFAMVMYSIHFQCLIAFGTVLHNYQVPTDGHIQKLVKCLRIKISKSQNVVCG